MGTRALNTATDAPALDYFHDGRNRPTMTLEAYELAYALRRPHAMHRESAPADPQMIWLADCQRGMLRQESGSREKVTVLSYDKESGFLVRIGWLGSAPLIQQFATFESLTWLGDEIVPLFLAEHGVAWERA